jgi:copper transport protein
MANMAGMAGKDMDGHSSPSHEDTGTETPVTAGPVTASVELPNDVRVEILADPARAGSAVLTLTIRSLSGDSAGELIDPPEVGITAALAEAGISPITLTPVRAEAGRFTVDAAPMLLAGLWKITVTVRTTETDAGVGSVEILLAPA